MSGETATGKYWDHELESLGLRLKRSNELNDIRERAALVDNLKQVAYQDYKTAFEQDGEISNSNVDYTLWGCSAGVKTAKKQTLGAFRVL